MDGEVSDACDVDFWRSVLAVVLLVFVLVVEVKFLESVGILDLAVVQDAVQGSSRWEVTHVDLESLSVIKRWVGGSHEAFSPQTEGWNSSADNVS